MKSDKLVKPLKSSYHTGLIEAGCDEAGRGCLAGPVFAAAVILPPDFTHPLLTDSKKLSDKLRYQLRPEIEQVALAWAVAQVDHQRIDEINILNASIEAMHLALSQLEIIPQHILVDGNRFKPYRQIPHTCVVKGDSLFYSIAAASVLAKTYRDDYMLQLHQRQPQYGWDINKGYPTLKHRKALDVHGQSPWHRKSFHLKNKQLTIVFE